jgi:hypothetical protein
MRQPRYLKGLATLLVGIAIEHFGERLLGVQLELFRGLFGFGLAWFTAMFILPFFVGVIVALLFGLGGKWLCYFPPLIVRVISYLQIIYVSGVPEGAALLPMGWWGFFVIVVMESAAIGGVMGEILVKGTYGRSARHLVYKDKKAVQEGDPGT